MIAGLVPFVIKDLMGVKNFLLRTNTAVMFQGFVISALQKSSCCGLIRIRKGW
jgi:hypothetical protein